MTFQSPGAKTLTPPLRGLESGKGIIFEANSRAVILHQHSRLHVSVRYVPPRMNAAASPIELRTTNILFRLPGIEDYQPWGFRFSLMAMPTVTAGEMRGIVVGLGRVWRVSGQRCATDAR